MQRTLIRRAVSARTGAAPWQARTASKQAFKSQFGPDYKVGFHVGGINATALQNYSVLAGGMGAVAGIFALFFFDGVPRVRKDILQKVPFIGGFFVKEIAPEDNPF